VAGKVSALYVIDQLGRAPPLSAMSDAMKLDKLVKMFDGASADQHTLEIGLEDIRAWHAEIERFTAVCKDKTELLHDAYAQVGRRDAEIVRLRAALGEIGYHAEGPYDETPAELSDWLKSIHAIAKAALTAGIRNE